MTYGFAAAVELVVLYSLLSSVSVVYIMHVPSMGQLHVLFSLPLSHSFLPSSNPSFSAPLHPLLFPPLSLFPSVELNLNPLIPPPLSAPPSPSSLLHSSHHSSLPSSSSPFLPPPTPPSSLASLFVFTRFGDPCWLSAHPLLRLPSPQ